MRAPRYLLKVALVVMTLCVAVSSAMGITVTSANDSGSGSFREAIQASAPNGTIDFSPSLNGSTILLSSSLTNARNVTINGPGATNLTISGNDVTRVFVIVTNALSPNTTVNISGLTISNGRVAGTNGADGTSGAPTGLPGGNAQGGGIFNDGTLTLFECVIQNCSASGGFGGRGYSSGGNGGNGGNASGGGLANRGTMILMHCTIHNNSATGGSGGGFLSGIDSSGSAGFGEGGGIVNWSTLLVTNCTFNANSATGAAGGVSASFLGSYNGLAGGPARGGAVDNQGTLFVKSCTIAGNSANGGSGGNAASASRSGGTGGNATGGAINQAGAATLRNTIVANNTTSAGAGGHGDSGANNGVAGTGTGPDLAGTVTSQGFNLISQVAGSSGWIVTDLLDVEPLLGPLQDNGGPTPTRAPQAGSAAIDNGIKGGVLTDQRGFARTVDLPGYTAQLGADNTDIGAVELQSPPPVVLDIGLRVYDGTAIVKIACVADSASTPLRIAKNGVTYGILLVATNSTDASKFRVTTSSGIKAWQKLP